MIDFCSIKEIQKALNELEDSFKAKYDICLNEASVLCSLSDCCLRSSEIAECADLKAPLASKTLRLVEDKGYIKREIGNTDRRMMRFTLTKQGRALLTEIKTGDIKVPEILASIISKKA